MIKKEELDEILTPLEQEKISQFVDDEEMFEAVRKVLLLGIYYEGTIRKGKKPLEPMENFALTGADDASLTDAQLGAIHRAAYWGINEVQLGLSNLLRYKKEIMLGDEPNPAR